MILQFDFQSKKTVHINLKKETHSGFRIALFKRGLSMQSVFEEFAQLVAAENPRVQWILDDLVERKKRREVMQLSDTEADEIYRFLEEESPLAYHLRG